MDYWALFTLGAIGWGGFVGCLLLLKRNDGIEFKILRRVTHDDGFPSGVIAIGHHALASTPIKQDVPMQQVEIEREIPDELHELAALASPFIDEIDATPQDGEWKRHQVYAKMLKRAPINGDKWKAAFAIELAIAQRRMGD